MSKELLVAGVIVAVCLGVTVLAFKQPAKSTPADQTEVASAEYPDASTSPSSMTPMDSFGRDNLQAPPGTADLNINRPFDNLGGPSTANPFPGASSQSVVGLPGSSSLPPVGASPISDMPTTPDATGTDRVHVVKRGDTLTEISKRYYGTTRHWQKIKEANQVDPDGLSEGTKLTIPALATTDTASTPAVAPSGDGPLYVVKKNDTYYKIAKQELGDASRAKEIEKLNKVSAADLRPGMKLALPSRGARETAASVETPALTVGDGRTHTVGKDEYLTDISKKYYGSTKHWRAIEKANPGIDPDRLKVGQKLVIPEVSGGTTATPAVAGEGEYVIVAGDTFEVIAGKVLGDKKQHKRIAEANPGVDSSRLRIGQKLKLPAGARGSDASLPAPTSPLTRDPVRSTPLPISEPAPVTPFPGPTFPAPTTLPSPAPAADPWNLGGGTGGTGAASVPANPWSDVGDSTPAPIR